MRTGGLALALFALTLKAMLPPGFMLSADAGQIAVTLCSGADVTLDLGKHDGQSGESIAQHCPFAIAAVAALPEAAPEFAAPAQRYALFTAAPVRQAVGVHDATGPPLPARGPPLNA